MTGLSVSKKIYNILSGDTAFNSLCSSYYPIIADEKVEYPFVLYKRDDIEVLDSKNYIAGDKVGFTFVIVNDKYALTVEIAERIRKLFEKRRDGYFSAVQFVGCDEEYSNDAYVQQLSFVATILNQNE